MNSCVIDSCQTLPLVMGGSETVLRGGGGSEHPLPGGPGPRSPVHGLGGEGACTGRRGRGGGGDGHDPPIRIDEIGYGASGHSHPANLTTLPFCLRLFRLIPFTGFEYYQMP